MLEGIPTSGEGTALYNCILCDSYSLITLGLLPDKKLARGLKGKKTMDDLLEAFQMQYAKEHVMLLACPTCNTYARQSSSADTSTSAASTTKSTATSGGGGKKKKGDKRGGDGEEDSAGIIVVGDQVEQGDFLRDGLAVLCPSFLVTFEEGELPPIYEDEQNQPGGKPKWRLAQGVGPAGLELDKSRTGRLHKNSLRPFGIDTRPLKLPPAIASGGEPLADAVRRACLYAEALVLCRGTEEASETLRRWRSESSAGGGGGGGAHASGGGASRCRPVLENWEEAAAAIKILDDDIQAYVTKNEAGEEKNKEERGGRGYSEAWQLDGFAA